MPTFFIKITPVTYIQYDQQCIGGESWKISCFKRQCTHLRTVCFTWSRFSPKKPTLTQSRHPPPATTHKTETLNVATRRVEPCLSCIYYSSLVPEFRAVKILNINNQQVKEKVGRRTVERSPLSPLPPRIG